MKKYLSFLVLILLIAFSATTVFASEKAEIVFETYSSEDGESIFVDANISKSNATMIQFCVDYDSKNLECVSATAGDVFSGTSAPLINKTEGKIYFIWDSLDPLNKGGTLLHIEFKPKNNSGSEVGIDEDETFIVANSNFEEIGVVGESAKVNMGEEESSSSSSSSSSSAPSSSSPQAPPESSSQESPESSSVSSSENQNTSSVPESSSKPDNSSSSSSSKAEIETGSNNGITVDKNQVSVDLEQEILIEIVDGEKEEVVWYSSNEDVAIVEDGKVIPVSPGTAIITVTTEDGTDEATCVVTVTDDETENEGFGSDAEIIVISGKPEGKAKTPGWAYAVIVILVLATAAAALLFVKKSKN